MARVRVGLLPRTRPAGPAEPLRSCPAPRQRGWRRGEGDAARVDC